MRGGAEHGRQGAGMSPREARAALLGLPGRTLPPRGEISRESLDLDARLSVELGIEGHRVEGLAFRVWGLVFGVGIFLESRPLHARLSVEL